MEPTFATNFFHRALSGEPPAAPGRHTCAVCGLPTTSETRVQTVLRPTFTDMALLRRPDSRTVCPACVWYFDHQELRRANWWLTADSAAEIARGDLRRVIDEHLAAPPGADGYLLITASKRKHIALRAPLNLAGSPVRRVQFEIDTLHLAAADVRAWRGLACFNSIDSIAYYTDAQAGRGWGGQTAGDWPAIAAGNALAANG